MRTGLFISAVSHIALVALVLLGTPKLFENAQLEAIEVELVRDQEPEPEPESLKEPPKKPPEKTAEWNPFSETAAAPAKSPAPETSSPSTKQPQPQPAQQARVPQPPQKELAAQKAPTQTPPPEQPTQQALAPLPSTDVAAETQQPWIFDPSNIPALMNLPNVPQSDFDSEATAAANISADDRTAVKTHLRKCWKLPDGLSATQTTRVTLRIFLRRDGGLAAEPMLIEASASREGPLLMQAAIRSVKECQPFGFLPADRYREWKALDVRFSPKEMAGG